MAERADARPFIAFKHINGPHRWESFAKAKFAASWYDAEKKRGDAGLSLTQIAERIGDNHDTIKRMIAAIYVLDQAADMKVFSIDDRTTRKFPFSHLYTALARSEYMAYLGLDESWTRFDPKPNPVSPQNLPSCGMYFIGSLDQSETINFPLFDPKTPTSRILAPCWHTPEPCMSCASSEI